MTYDGIIATFGEVFLKGRNRHRFINQIMLAVARKLTPFPAVTTARTHANLTVELNGTDPEAVLAALGQVFGLQTFQLYVRCEAELAAMKEAALQVARQLESQHLSIKVAAKRGDKSFPLTSPEIASQIGRYVAANCDVQVDMHNPDARIKVLVQRSGSYIVSRELSGPGGLPIGVNGATLLMLSGGLDSPVAAYLMMKRGLAVEALHFDSPPYTSPRARQKVFDLTEKLAHYMPTGTIHLHVVPFTSLQKAIFEHVPESYGMTVMRRMMYRVAEGVARRARCCLISNGESLGQVASQTPQSMLAINSVITTPVIRPVACMDKIEIVKLARQIKTYDISIRPYEDCCTVFVPKSPATSPKAARCEQYEQLFEWQPMVQACIDQTECTTIAAGNPIRIDSDTSEEICALL